ncbi:MAG: methyltransferase domain-containing protein [Candidatus Magasanikbacteria bacterium]|nr:methyltransferase domain-containing protein [Candidatus Magasanikbacteria bacterium]
MEHAEYISMDALERNHWWFQAKRIFLDIVLSWYMPQKNLQTLDVGCGTGAVMQMLIKKGYRSEGVDFSDVALEFCRKKNLTVSKGFAEKLPYPDNSFDVVTVLDVLEHLTDETLAINEIQRVLRPGGVVVATVPAHQFLWSYHDEELHHHRRYNKKNFTAIFKGKLDILHVSWIHFFIVFPAVVVRLLLKLSGSEKKSSDIKKNGKIVTFLMHMIYNVEYFLFRCFKKLPIGLSLIIVAKKKI